MLYDHDGTLLDGDYLHYDKAWSAPCFYDVDQDGEVDLVVGNATGRLSFYKGSEELGVRSEESPRRGNIPIAQGNALGNVEFWGGVDVRDYATSYYGYSVPIVFQQGDETLLAVGSESGKVFLFDGVSVEENAVFREAPERWEKICEDMPSDFGMRSAAAIADLNNDNQMDILTGNFAGGLQLFNAEITVTNLGISEQQDDFKVEIFPNPVSSQIHIVSKEDDIKTVIVTDLFGRKLTEKTVRAKEMTLDLSALTKGVYLLILDLECGLVNRIFLKR